MSRTIMVSEETWQRLEGKTGPQGTADEKISRILDLAGGKAPGEILPGQPAEDNAAASLHQLLQGQPWFQFVGRTGATDDQLIVYLRHKVPRINLSIPSEWRGLRVSAQVIGEIAPLGKLNTG